MQTASNPFSKLRSSNATDAGLPSRVATITEPTGSGVISLDAGSGITYNNLLLMPFGVGNSNDTFNMRIIGWRKVGPLLWVPAALCQLTCTLGTGVGVDGFEVDDAEKFVDSLNATLGNVGIDLSVVSPADNTTAHAIVDTKGFTKVEIVFGVVSGTTSMNTLFAVL